MRNFTLLILSGFLFGGTIGLSQEIIIETSRTLEGSTAQHRNHTELTESDLISSYENTKVYESSTSEVGNNANLGEQFVLTLNLINPSNNYLPMSITIFDEGEFYENQSFSGNPMIFNLPSGTYEIVSFSINQTTDWQSYVIKEQVEISADSSIDLNLGDADNLMTLKFLDADGNDLKPGEYNPDTGEIEGGTANVYATTYLYFEPKNWTPYVSYYLWENSLGNVGEFWNFYVSETSDRYSFIHSNLGVGYDNNGYVSKYPTITNVSSSLNLQNEPDEWVVHNEKFRPSIEGENQGEFYYGLSNWDTYYGMGLSGWVARLFRDEANFNEGLDVYLNNPMDEDPANILLYPVLEDYFGIVDPGYGEESLHINGNAILLDENRNVLYGSGSTSSSFYFTGYDYLGYDEGVKLLPLHPKFSFSADQESDIYLANNTPLMINSYNGMLFRINYIGRFGESRESDIFDIQLNVSQNGTQIFNGDYTEFVFSDPIESGEIEINLTNSNTQIGSLIATTTSKINFDADHATDKIPPTVQMLQFRNAEDEVKDQFSEEEEGFVRLAAADFEYNPDNRNYVYKPGNQVQFLYSEIGENDWTELTLTHLPEFYFEPGFGDYYEASLGSITPTGNDAWYDVKIICTDAVGNTQEQTLSPAFKLNSTLGLEEEMASDLQIFPNPFEEKINIRFAESIQNNLKIQLMDITGKNRGTPEYSKVSDRLLELNTKYLPKGIYIISLEVNGKFYRKKLIKN